MGTRNLTMVVKDKKTKVAQYGQWDGNPAGQGEKVLKFLEKADLKKFKKDLDNVSFVSKKEISTWETMKHEDWVKKYPHMDRDIGADILNRINGDKIRLINQEVFASESLHNEWSYVIDLDKNQLEVYKGFRKKPVPKNERFAKYNEKAEKESREFSDYNNDGTEKKKKYKYYPIKLVKIYKFNALPSLAQFIKECDPEDGEN